ncbi:MAG: hypothetical protein FWC70_12645 [Defluviitaleaceae bacterium]|nr:hypothetical protein [Defluviitaleaceae bacterium]
MGKSNELLDALRPSLFREVDEQVEKCLNRAGLFFRVFSRVKSSPSSIGKIEKKNYCDNKKMQDLYGIRIALYFRDDVEICQQLICNTFKIVGPPVIDSSDSITFQPTRINYVCALPTIVTEGLDKELWKLPIDKTFEIQVRTIFSEGWHEVEHDLRYKAASDWDGHDDLARSLNGILGTLETCDWAINQLFQTLAHHKYKEKNWEAMLRNLLRIRIVNPVISENIQAALECSEFAKKLFRINRMKFLLSLGNHSLGNIPKTSNNLVYIANELYIKNKMLKTPSLIVDAVKKCI